MEFIARFLDVFLEDFGDGIGLLISAFIYLSIFAKQRKKWSLRKEIGILILVSLGIAIVLCFFQVVIEGILINYK